MLLTARLPGALLFIGEEGLGKKLFALELAKSLNCRTRLNEVEACDVCSSCKRIGSSKFPPHKTIDENKELMIWSEHTDLALIRPFNRMIRVDPMRQLDKEAQFRPYEGNARVFVVEDADKMNEASSNALLKTLEEPPDTTHLILVTSRPASLLPTIRSRCQAIRFVPLTAPEIEKLLIKRDAKLSKDEAVLRAHAARGSIGRALEIDLSEYVEQRQAMLDVIDALALPSDRTRLLRAAEVLCDAKRKEEYEPRLDLLETLLHDVWTLSLRGSVEGLTNIDLRDHLARLATEFESTRVARWISYIEKHRRQLDSNINRKVATDALFLQMADGL